MQSDLVLEFREQGFHLLSPWRTLVCWPTRMRIAEPAHPYEWQDRGMLRWYIVLFASEKCEPTLGADAAGIGKEWTAGCLVETQNPNFSNSSEATRSCPHVGYVQCTVDTSAIAPRITVIEAFGSS
jgi:hypothetical protein